MNKDKVISLFISLALIVGALFWVIFSGGGESYQYKYEGADLDQLIEGTGREDSYSLYLHRYSDAADAQAEVAVDLLDFISAEGVRAENEQTLYTAEDSFITWNINVPQSGFYNIRISYLTTKSRGVDIERSVYINGSVPFFGANSLVFPRMWTDAGEVRTDNRGNQIRPTQTEVFGWQESYFMDSLGYEAEPYRFYFEAGGNTLSLEATNEPMTIGDLRLVPVTNLPDYDEYAQSFTQADASGAARNALITMQGEDAVLRSSPSLYARYDRSSPTTEPSSITTTVLNYIGGDPWRHAGEWIEWEFEVPDDGMYNITIKGRQRYSRGSVSSRILYLDGEIPFEQMKDVSFAFDNKWEIKTLGDGDGEYAFYLSAGKHTLRLEATLGGMGSILTDLDESIFRLNQIYRRLLVLTGVKPDTFRDYNLQAIYPELIDSMHLESMRLYRVVDQTVAYTGQKSDRIAAAQTLAAQLETYVEDPNKVTQSFTNFKDNITALGTASQNLSEVKLDIDWIVVSGTDVEPAAEKEYFFSMLWHEVRSTAASYFVDYDALGDVYTDTEDVLSVWILTGRDQSTVLKTMVDDTFTPQTGIKVNIKLVDPTALLGAVVAGNGPDVVVSTDTWNPVNYALRNSAEDLTQFADFDEVISQFRPSAYAALQWGGGVYGLPETQLVSLLFYRKDILDEYGLEVPETWQDLINLLPTIQGNNMSIGVPFPTIAAPNLFSYYSLIYQQGGRIYSDDAKYTVVNEEPAVRAFEFYTRLYTDYGLPVEYDFLTRFRSGEMPIGISEYNTYNFLVVAAPEIRGLWDFTLIPGTYRTDENGVTTLDRSVHSQGVSCMMVRTEDEWVKKNGWEFMKWWVSTESQLRFGREIEAVLGASARHPTANIEALRSMAWNMHQLEILEAALSNAVGFPEIAGGYYTARNLTNAVRKVYNDKVDPRETILDYARLIDIEITAKRIEFGLDVK